MQNNCSDIVAKASQNKSTNNNVVRINAGAWRSRLLKFPDVEGLRPSPERVRQTVFNWLGQDMTSKVCLDLFSGTGAFGFEALSRNAISLTMVEFSKQASKSLSRNKALLKAENCQILNMDVMQFLASNQQRFDLIFCDPPYQKQWLDKLLPILSNHLSKEGILYAEAEYKIESDANWAVLKQGKAGNVYYHLLKCL